jgi:hypothetical protein
MQVTWDGDEKVTLQLRQLWVKSSIQGMKALLNT